MAERPEGHGVETYYQLAERLAEHPETATDEDVRALARAFIDLWRMSDNPQVQRTFCVPVGML